MESTDHIPMDFDTAPGDYFADEISVTETVDKSGEKIKDNLKVQTEPANPYLQYMRAKKKENPGIALNRGGGSYVFQNCRFYNFLEC